VAMSGQNRTAENSAAELHEVLRSSDGARNNANPHRPLSEAPQSVSLGGKERRPRVQGTSYGQSTSNANPGSAASGAAQEAQRFSGEQVYQEPSESAIADAVGGQKLPGSPQLRNKDAQKAVMDPGPLSETTARVFRV
jgi:hypothetical protein